MRRLLIVLLTLALTSAVSASAAAKASGKLTVNDANVELKHAFVYESGSLVRVVLSDRPLAAEEAGDQEAMNRAVAEGKLNAIIVQLDEQRKADEVFFFHPQLPAGLSVRQTAKFKSSVSTPTKLGGTLTMDDDGFSFGFKAKFEAPITKMESRFKPLPADASPADYAKRRLEQLDIRFNETGFRSAVIGGNAEVVKLFIDAGMAPDTDDALSTAVDLDQVEVAKVLIDAGADVKVMGPYKKSLALAAADASPEMMKLLIASGADINIPNEYRITPLSSAAEQGKLETVKLLIAAGARVNARDTAGGTALSVAVLRGYEEIVKVLIAAGADVKRDKDDLRELAKDKPAILDLIEAALRKK